jgi:hypothetical protein
VGQHRTPRNAKLGSGVAEEETSWADRSHPPCALSRKLSIWNYSSPNPVFKRQSNIGYETNHFKRVWHESSSSWRKVLKNIFRKLIINEQLH